MSIVGWIIGIALMFGLSLVLNYYTFESLKGFLIFLLLFNSFVVWADLLPFWSIILNIVIVTYIIYIEYKNKNISDN